LVLNLKLPAETRQMEAALGMLMVPLDVVAVVSMAPLGFLLPHPRPLIY